MTRRVHERAGAHRVVLGGRLDVEPIYVSLRQLPFLEREVSQLREYEERVRADVGCSFFNAHGKQVSEWMAGPKGMREGTDRPAGLRGLLQELGWAIDESGESFLDERDLRIEPGLSAIPLAIERIRIPDRACLDGELIVNDFVVVGAGMSLQSSGRIYRHEWGGVFLEEALDALDVSERANAVTGEAIPSIAWVSWIVGGVASIAEHHRQWARVRVTLNRLGQLGRRHDYYRICHAMAPVVGAQWPRNPDVADTAIHDLATRLGAMAAFGLWVGNPESESISEDGRIVSAESVRQFPSDVLPHHVMRPCGKDIERGWSAAGYAIAAEKMLMQAGAVRGSQPPLLSLLREYLRSSCARMGVVRVNDARLGAIASELQELIVSGRALASSEHSTDANVIGRVQCGSQGYQITDPDPQVTRRIRSALRELLDAGRASVSDVLAKYNRRKLPRLAGGAVPCEFGRGATAFARNRHRIANHLAENRYCNPSRVAVRQTDRIPHMICEVMGESLAGRASALAVVFVRGDRLRRDILDVTKPPKLKKEECGCIVEAVQVNFGRESYWEPIGPILLL